MKKPQMKPASRPERGTTPEVKSPAEVLDASKERLAQIMEKAKEVYEPGYDTSLRIEDRHQSIRNSGQESLDLTDEDDSTKIHVNRRYDESMDSENLTLQIRREEVGESGPIEGGVVQVQIDRVDDTVELYGFADNHERARVKLGDAKAIVATGEILTVLSDKIDARVKAKEEQASDVLDSVFG